MSKLIKRSEQINFTNDIWKDLDKTKKLDISEKRIFDDIKKEDLFFDGYSFHSAGGIVALCTESTKNSEINKRVRKIISE